MQFLKNYRGVIADIAILVVIISAGLWLRVAHVDRLSFWQDEAISVSYAEQIIVGNLNSLPDNRMYDRAFAYHKYLAWVLETFQNGPLQVTSRLANIPFYILTAIGIFLLAIRVGGRTVGYFATTLFCLSWISISMFREARFYEMLTCLTLFVGLILFQLDSLVLEKFKKYRTRTLALSVVSLTALLVICTYFAWTTSPLVGILLYSLVLYGILIFVFKKDKAGLFLAGASFCFLIIGFIFNYKDEFRWKYIFKFPLPEWRSYYPDYPFLTMWSYTVERGHFYLPYIAVMFIVLLLYKKVSRGALFTLAIVVSWYSIVALQGYSSDALRYFYPGLPFLLILIAYTLNEILDLVETRMVRTKYRFIKKTVLVSLAAYSFCIGVIESRSPITNSSYNSVKNFNSDAAMEFLKKRIDAEPALVLTDQNFKFVYYLAFGSLPSAVVIDTDLMSLNAIPKIDYRQISQINNPLYFVFRYEPAYMSPLFMEYINKNGCEVYNDYPRLIYFFPEKNSPSTSSSSLCLKSS